MYPYLFGFIVAYFLSLSCLGQGTILADDHIDWDLWRIEWDQTQARVIAQSEDLSVWSLDLGEAFLRLQAETDDYGTWSFLFGSTSGVVERNSVVDWSDWQIIGENIVYLNAQTAGDHSNWVLKQDNGMQILIQMQLYNDYSQWTIQGDVQEMWIESKIAIAMVCVLSSLHQKGYLD